MLCKKRSCENELSELLEVQHGMCVECFEDEIDHHMDERYEREHGEKDEYGN